MIPDRTWPWVRQAPRTRRPCHRRLAHATVMTLRGIFRLEDSPQRIALGSAAGIFSSALPILGQTFIGLGVAKAVRGNLVASLPWSWISNPLTTLPMWYAGYRLGHLLLPGGGEAIGYDELSRLVATLDGLGWWEQTTAVFRLLLGILAPLWVGCTVLGVAMAAPAGLVIARVVAGVQERRARRHRQWYARNDAAPG